MRITDDNLPTAVALIGVCLTLILTLAGFLLISGRFAIGTAAGGGLALLNFLQLKTALVSILQMPTDKATRTSYVRYLLRLSVLGFTLWILIAKAGIDIAGLLTGLSVLVVAIVIMTFYKLLHQGG